MTNKNLTNTDEPQKRPLQSKQHSRKSLGREKPIQYRVENGQLSFDLDNMEGDKQQWYQSLVQTSGCHSPYAANELMSSMFQSVAGHLKEDESKANGMAAMLHELDPQDAAEGMLCANMVTLQHWIGRCGNIASAPQNNTELSERLLNKMVKLMNTQARHVEVLQKYRNKGQQTISVQHVTVNDGAQAIVGNITGKGHE